MFGKLPRRSTVIEIIIVEFVISDLVCSLANLGREALGIIEVQIIL